MLRKKSFYSLAIAAFWLCSSIGQADDLIEKAAATSKLKTFSSLLEQADLVETLNGEEPFTIFTPTDEAFAELPATTLQYLLKTENKEQLARVINYHIVPGRLTEMDVANIDAPQMARTANGQRLPIRIEQGEFRAGPAKVMSRPIPCSNGLIYLIDQVLLPPELQTEEAIKMKLKEADSTSVLEALRAVPDGRFSLFLEAVEASGGDQDWAQSAPSGNWTLFVPTNNAFSRLSQVEKSALFDPKNRESLRQLLDWHALPKLQPWSFEFSSGERGAVMVSRQSDRFVLDVLSSGLVFVYQLRSANIPREREEPFKARILAGDIQVGGTLVNIIDRVIVPRELEGKILSSQAYRETDVVEFNAGADARDNARQVLQEMLQKAQQLDQKGEMAMYQMGLQMLEDVLPVSRNGVIVDGADMSTPTNVRQRLQTRLSDLDRVWYGNFMNNSPAGKSLSDPLPEFYSVTSTGNSNQPADKISNNAETPAANRKASDIQNVVSTPQTPSPSANPIINSDLAWCEVLEKEVDEKVVTNPAQRAAITATGLPWRVRDKASGIEMLLVPPGQFKMGRTSGDQEAKANELPTHSVTLTKSYYLGRYEVTQSQWSRIMKDETPIRRPQSGPANIQIFGEFRGEKGTMIQGKGTSEQQPNGAIVFNLSPEPSNKEPLKAANLGAEIPALASWAQCSEFCRKTGLRLPSEAEWEFACRSGVEAPRYGELDQIAWHRGNADGTFYPVGTKRANGLGFHDMIGNAWEWVNDWYSEYTRSPKTDPTGPASGTSRIVRGGYFDYEDGFCRSSLRYSIDTPEFNNSIGFRVARNP
ncbi:MAG: fasciclin domain-containing protein [Pirellula sp.]|jgi:uncharacterized surface protein with fasciclin (FAS1) repeats/formylglycine-generating enzyme required for sulfatase activity